MGDKAGLLLVFLTALVPTGLGYIGYRHSKKLQSKQNVGTPLIKIRFVSAYKGIAVVYMFFGIAVMLIACVAYMLKP